MKQNKIIVSIITPSFNQGEFIEQTIQSVLFQEGDFYIDYIIMDGGSHDNSVEIIKKYETLLQENSHPVEINGHTFYQKTNPLFPWHQCAGIHFHWESQRDNGQVHALKKGFALAKGHILCWLNSDDIYVNPQVFQKVCTTFTLEPHLKLVTGDGPFIAKDGSELGIHHVDQINIKELLYLDYHILQPSTFFHKDVYQEQHLQEKYTCAFDADFFIHLLVSRVPFKKVDDLLGAFRFYADNKTLRLNKRRYQEQKSISWTYSKNPFYYLLSSLYRYFEIRLKHRYLGKHKWFDRLFFLIKRTSYTIITGKPQR